MSVLSAEDHAFFAENGYVVVPNAVPQENLDAVVDAIWEFLGMNPDDPVTWYQGPVRHGGMVEMYQHQAMWDNRQYPRVHQAFSELFDTEKLWVSEDRVSMKPPVHPDYPEYNDKGFIHWDADTSKLPLRFRVQGVLCLTDTTADMGGFQCIPGFHRGLEEWIKTQPADRNPHAPDLNALPEGMKVTPIPGQAGDLIIWINTLAHGNGLNVSSRPRLAQYINMYPAPDDEAMRQARIERWRERKAPQTHWAHGDPRRLEELSGKTAELTPLGRKLLGLDLWE
ncbi:MAG: phytanoyl-CoA dioxygenase family protein [Abitibacteriaceae bacterium]|nr:phytanoyl-CoA dioxygenase family protein [Abditibacteriaceae bacterium]